MKKVFATAISIFATGSMFFVQSAEAKVSSIFSQTEVDQSNFIAVASPYSQGLHQLLIIEQQSEERECWSEKGNEPVIVDPLLVQFDFTDICGRAIDANGYSIRINGEELGVKYSLRVRRRDGDLLLVGIPEKQGEAEIRIGRTGGVTDGFAKIKLDPGWRFTKRTYNNQILDHTYLTKDSTDLVDTEADLVDAEAELVDAETDLVDSETELVRCPTKRTCHKNSELKRSTAPIKNGSLKRRLIDKTLNHFLPIFADKLF